MVFREGFEALNSLPSNEKKWIAPLPIPYDSTLPGYVKMIEMMGGHGGENLPKAQALKDATMAHNILENHIQGHFSSITMEAIIAMIMKEFIGT